MQDRHVVVFESFSKSSLNGSDHNEETCSVASNQKEIEQGILVSETKSDLEIWAPRKSKVQTFWDGFGGHSTARRGMTNRRRNKKIAINRRSAVLKRFYPNRRENYVRKL